MLSAIIPNSCIQILFHTLQMFDVMAYSTADKYNLLTLREKLKEQGLYGYVPLPSGMYTDCNISELIYVCIHFMYV